MNVREISCRLVVPGTSQTVSISAVSAQSAAIKGTPSFLVVYTSTGCFVRYGVNPTALADGTDQYLVGGNQYRIEWNPEWENYKIAFITTAAAGTVYITPGG